MELKTVEENKILTESEVTRKLLTESTIESVMLIINSNGFGSIEKLSDAILMIRALANEIIQLKKRETENRLLIQHEETVRTTKAKPVAGGKNTTTKYKVGDIVDYSPSGTQSWGKAKIVQILSRGALGKRIIIELIEDTLGVGKEGQRRWVGSDRLRFHLAKAS